MFPNDKQMQKVKEHIFDPFEYLMLRHKEGKLKIDFKQPLGKIAYHAPCHQRVQNMGQKTRELLSLIPDTEIQIIARFGPWPLCEYHAALVDSLLDAARPE